MQGGPWPLCSKKAFPISFERAQAGSVAHSLFMLVIPARGLQSRGEYTRSNLR
jgi:hypothetical protein